MGKAKKPIHRVQITDGKRAFVRLPLEERDVQTAGDIQLTLKDLLKRGWQQTSSFFIFLGTVLLSVYCYKKRFLRYFTNNDVRQQLS